MLNDTSLQLDDTRSPNAPPLSTTGCHVLTELFRQRPECHAAIGTVNVHWYQTERISPFVAACLDLAQRCSG